MWLTVTSRIALSEMEVADEETIRQVADHVAQLQMSTEQSPNVRGRDEDVPIDRLTPPTPSDLRCKLNFGSST
jgi:hypothetical protein